MPTRPPGTPDIDLTFDNTFGLLNGAVFMTGLDQSAGTGTFNSFVQIQHAGTEQGYNTDAKAQYDERSALNHNHSVLLADIPIVFGDGSNGTTDGVAYREILLDLNEGGIVIGEPLTDFHGVLTGVPTYLGNLDPLRKSGRE